MSSLLVFCSFVFKPHISVLSTYSCLWVLKYHSKQCSSYYISCWPKTVSFFQGKCLIPLSSSFWVTHFLFFLNFVVTLLFFQTFMNFLFLHVPQTLSLTCQRLYNRFIKAIILYSIWAKKIYFPFLIM